MAEKDKGSVVQFDASLVRKLQLDLVALKQERTEIIEGSRLYWQRVQAVHEAVLLLQDAKDMAEAIGLLQEDAARLLGFDVITLIYERMPDDGIGGFAAHLKPIPTFMINAAFSATEYHIVEDRVQLETLFPEQSALMTFAICIPIKTDKRRGALLMASRSVPHASAGQALEPYVFLARCIEKLGKQWLTDETRK